MICDEREWRVHKAVLVQCDYFKTAITMGFRVCTFVDPNTVSPSAANDAVPRKHMRAE